MRDLALRLVRHDHGRRAPQRCPLRGPADPLEAARAGAQPDQLRKEVVHVEDRAAARLRAPPSQAGTACPVGCADGSRRSRAAGRRALAEAAAHARRRTRQRSRPRHRPPPGCGSGGPPRRPRARSRDCPAAIGAKTVTVVPGLHQRPRLGAHPHVLRVGLVLEDHRDPHRGAVPTGAGWPDVFPVSTRFSASATAWTSASVIPANAGSDSERAAARSACGKSPGPWPRLRSAGCR